MKAWIKVALEVGVQVWQLWRAKKDAPEKAPDPERAEPVKVGKRDR